MDVALTLPEDEARHLYQKLHRLPDGQDRFCETYRQLQGHFFQTMTIEEVTELLEGDQ